MFAHPCILIWMIHGSSNLKLLLQVVVFANIHRLGAFTVPGTVSSINSQLLSYRTSGAP